MAISPIRDLPRNPTARDLLEFVGGREHALHTVIECELPANGKVKFTCSCGDTFKTKAAHAKGPLRHLRAWREKRS